MSNRLVDVTQQAEAIAYGDQPAGLKVWQPSATDGPIPPRGWLLGTTFARGFLSGVIAAGATGKTAVRHTQLLSLATGRQLSGEHVHHRARVLILSLEDGELELRRRIRAAQLFHDIGDDELQDHLFLSAPGGTAGKLMVLDDHGRPQKGPLHDELKRTIERHRVDVVAADPFVKLHGLEENANSALDDLMVVLADIATEFNVAVDLAHHTKKGVATPGDADLGRGASAVRDACRLVTTLQAMSQEEAQAFDVSEAHRRRFVRMDNAKVNLAPPAANARWFELVGVDLNNGTEDYPAGDTVQSVRPWHPPDAWDGLTTDLLNRVLDDIAEGLEDGNRYSDGPNVRDRAAWQVVQAHAPDKTEADCRQVIKTWVKNGVLTRDKYQSPTTHKSVVGLYVNDARRPGA
jgi:hypothetical protein